MNMGRRLGGLALFAGGLFLIFYERARMAGTGRAGRKAAVVPFLLCVGLAFLIDPENRRPAILATAYLLGAAASVAWFILWQ